MARPKEEQPTHVKTDQMGDTFRHPAFACIRASRVSGNAVLFGSDFVHHNFIRVEIVPATLTRGLSQDWIHGSVQPYVEVSLSEAQWATFVSTLNSGSGTPCKLEYRSPDAAPIGQVPDLPTPISRKAQFGQEMAEHLDRPVQRLKALLARIDGLKLPAKARDEITQAIAMAVQDIKANVPFVANQFGEHVENTVEAARIEIEAHLNAVIQRAGLQALKAAGGDQAPFELTDQGAADVPALPAKPDDQD